MSNTNDIKSDIPAGDIQFYDNYIPVIKGGNYFITTQQTLKTGSNTTINGDSLGSVQEFIVSAPQFSIDTSQVINMYPPAGSTGLYGEVLPHIVLKDPVLAWERAMAGTATPWLALMVFDESELNGGDSNTKSIQATVDEFLKIATPVLAPKPNKEDDVDSSTSCRYINIPIEVFRAVVPHLDELPYLSHIRKVNTGGKPILGISEHGLYSVIASNRFVSKPDAGQAKPVKNIVHLVSLEGMENYLKQEADLSAYTSVSLISLTSWTFLSLPDISQDFNALVTNLVKQETESDKTINPKKLWLRLPPPATGSGDAMSEVTKRTADGFVPLAYHTRSGENTFAWYRGPLTPLLTQKIPVTQPFFTSDSAMIYDKTFGIFDVSLAAAWETGREAALSDSGFGQKIFNFRKKAHQLTDSLLYKLNSDHFTATQIDQLDNTTTVQDTFLNLLTPQLIKDIGTIADSAGGGANQSGNPAITDPVIDARNFLSNPDVQAKLMEIIAHELAPVAEWLANFMLLYPVPFDNLVADERMLPVESLRFFYIDMNWLSVGVDGAMSLGLDSSRQSFFSQTTKGIVHNAAMQALGVIRDKLEGRQTDSPPVPPTVMSGFLLRSALVTGWPNLVIRAKDENDTSLKILRLDHLSSSVLLCIFDGVPMNIELSEPQESLGFGVDDNGKVVLRNILAGVTPAIGGQIGELQIRDLSGETQLCMRSPASRVLNIAPGVQGGLIQTLVAGLKQLGCEPPGDQLGPATFAIQMIKSAEAIVFSSQTS
jgi:hypothetical protein